MQIAVLAAIHANADALCAVLTDARHAGASLVLSLGDNVGYNAQVRRTLAMLQREGIPSVYGDHELMVGGLFDPCQCSRDAADKARRIGACLTPEDRRYLSRLPSGLHLGATLFLHGQWGNPLRSIDSDMECVAQRELVGRWEPQVSVCFTGHADCPQMVEIERSGAVRRSEIGGAVQLGAGSFYFVTPGRVGVSADATSTAAYVLYDTTRRRVEARRVAYDHQEGLSFTGRARLAEAS